ncbi:NERD domain-containing protein [Lactobacillus sp.]|uniref:NERD domain-containing protein n=1 Tax=Lactobacillus sp. TaxID=1591 RepID=UPI003EF42268
MNTIFNSWFTSKPVNNETTIQSARKIEQLLDPNYDCLKQLSGNNLTSIRHINDTYIQYNLQNQSKIPVLSESQMKQTECLLAGDAGERLVDQAVRQLACSNKIILNNVLLPYQYGQYGAFHDNQIDNLLITETGIYCIEVKTRTIKGNLFDLSQLSTDIVDQLAFHKEAILETLQPEIELNPAMIKPIIVIVNRLGIDNFRLINNSELENAGAKATTVKYLNLTISNDSEQSLLTPSQISQINLKIRNRRLPDRRTYPDNVCFVHNPGLLQQVNFALKRKIPIEQIISYQVKMNDIALTGLNNKQQDFFWLIIGKLYCLGDHELTLTRKELREAADYRSKDNSKLDNSLNRLAAFMRTTGLFQKSNYESGKLTIQVKRNQIGRFNCSNNDFMHWNYQTFKQLNTNTAKTLFRKFTQYSEVGYYQASFQELRQLLGIPQSCGNSDVVKVKIELALQQLLPFFSNLSYRVTKKGRSNKISEIEFRFSPSSLL